ncbi:MAG: hypothetical protein ACI9WC_002088 [Arenicella sp.]|jgi:hypothetical protein
MKRITLILSLMLMSALLHAENESIIGVWKYFHQDTGKEASLIKIDAVEGIYTGTAIRFLDSKDSPEMRCGNCKDERKGKPILGMLILKNVSKSKDNSLVGWNHISDDYG